MSGTVRDGRDAPEEEPRLSDAPLVVELLSVLQPRLGTYLRLGNHEYDAGAPSDFHERGGFLAHLLRLTYRDALSSGADEGDATGEALRQLGVQVLRNEGVRLPVDGQSVWLAGVDSSWARRDDLEAAMSGRREGEGSLVLIHEPELAFAAVEIGADVILAGHTHGGQVRLPLIGAPYWHKRDERLLHASGLQAIGRAWLHISAGLGQLVPLRILCPPEVVWLTCVPAPVAPERTLSGATQAGSVG